MANWGIFFIIYLKKNEVKKKKYKCDTPSYNTLRVLKMKAVDHSKVNVIGSLDME